MTRGSHWIFHMSNEQKLCGSGTKLHLLSNYLHDDLNKNFDFKNAKYFFFQTLQNNSENGTSAALLNQKIQ